MARGYHFIDEITASSTVESFVISNLPQDYQDIEIYVRMEIGTADFYVRLNNDTVSRYTNTGFGIDETVKFSRRDTNQNRFVLLTSGIGSGTGYARLQLNGYSNKPNSVQKSAWLEFAQTTNPTEKQTAGIMGGVYRSTNPITSVSWHFFSVGAGTKFLIYGYGDIS